MAFSASVKSRKGTSVRTPMARHTSVISDHISEFQGATAPSSMVRTRIRHQRRAVNCVRTTPVPPQVRQAPWLLKASSSAEGAKKCAPHSGQTRSCPAATASDGGTACPFGQRWLARRENIKRRLFSSSVPVPKVLRMPGTPGRWCKRQRRGHIQRLVHLRPGRLRHAAARVGGKRLQIAARAFRVQNAQRQRGLARAGYPGDAHDLVAGARPHRCSLGCVPARRGCEWNRSWVSFLYR